MSSVTNQMCCTPLADAALSESDAEELASVLKALADPIRLRIVSLIATAPCCELCACDLPELLGRSQPTMSHHLTTLVKAGILQREQRGKWAWFSLRPESLAAVCATLAPAAPADEIGPRAAIDVDATIEHAR